MTINKMKKLPIILSFALIACLPGCKSAATKSLILKAEQGDAAAQYELGVLYKNGWRWEVHRNPAIAAKWYRNAAEQGHAEAQYNLGRMYETGWWTPSYQSPDYVEAAKWYRMAAEQGHAEAQYNLGLLYEKGEGVGKDRAEAVKWYRMAAEQGNAQAQYELGVIYRRGWGVPRDDAEAVKWYRMASEQGHADAQNMLKSYGKFEENYEKAGQGDAYAQYEIGKIYDNGGDAVARDRAEANKWYLKAAEQGEAQAQYQLGFNYNYGRGMSKDYIEALKWYRLAAAQGHEKAKTQLGLLNHFEETRQKAETGEARAQYELGRIYEQGAGVDKDAPEAKKWYGLADGQGYADAKTALTGMRYDEMVEKLRAENERLVRELRAENEQQARALRAENERLARELREETERLEQARRARHNSGSR